MSARALHCDACDADRVFAGARMFVPGEETTYAVAWRCPKCNETALDVCPSGAIEPSATSCINCGSPLVQDSCGACGMSREEVIEFLGLTAIEIDDARRAFEGGLLRRGFAILDARLQRDPNDFDAWCRKAANYRALRLDALAARCRHRVYEVLRHKLDLVEGDARLPLWLDMSEIANDAEDADVGLDAADAVLAIDPRHLRGLYLRGWALGLLGRLPDARDAMRRILELDPVNADARAALEKIDAALA